jgi:regulator of extracellular matrix RemA (YlzA/DUF370 family)
MVRSTRLPNTLGLLFCALTEKTGMLLYIGHKNFLVARLIVEILGAGSARAQKLKREAAKDGKLIDAAWGRRAKSVIVMKSSHVVISSVDVGTIWSRLVRSLSLPENAVVR